MNGTAPITDEPASRLTADESAADKNAFEVARPLPPVRLLRLRGPRAARRSADAEKPDLRDGW
jgi:hypothetical protein